MAVFELQAKSSYVGTHSFKSKFKENNVLIVTEGTKISGTEHLIIQNLNSENDAVSKIYINGGTFVSGAENIDSRIIVIPVNFEKRQSKSLVRRKTKNKVVTTTFKRKKSHQSSPETICYPKKENHSHFIISKISAGAIANFENSFQTALSQYSQCSIVSFLINKDSEKLTYRNNVCILSSYSQVHITRPPPPYRKITNSI